MNIGAYVIRRALLMVVVLIGTITVTFFLSHLVPANPALFFAGQNPTPQQIQAITNEYGLNQPLYVQFYVYLQNVFTGNLGTSFSFQLPVLSLILEGLPNTLTLAAIATGLALLIGIPLGIEAARHGGKKLDSVLRVVSVGFVGLPQFWLGILLQLVFAVSWGILPIGSYGGTLTYLTFHPIRSITGSYLVDAALSGDWSGFAAVGWSMILPIVTLTLAPLGTIIRHTRASMMATLNQDYVRTARAYGLPERQINYGLAFRNALPPVLVYAGLIFAGSIVGVIYVEDVFNLIPGIGYLVIYGTGTGISSSGFTGNPDVPLLLGVAIVAAIIYAVSNFVVDIIQIYYDRRIIK
ncbi:MAG: ABC transporter permease [Thaumarchaeota archaeon]|nr:ABC transporter permease [Nitrososphaerota archaeon]